MSKKLVYLLFLIGMPALAVEDLCSISIQGEAPLKQIAPSILQADLEAGRNANDPLKAINLFQKHHFYVKHPNNPGPASISRCGPPTMYRKLSDETAKVVSSLTDNYKKKRWFLSANESENPGLLRLLLLSNQYGTFLTEAEAFLISAKDDPDAPELFARVHQLMRTRENNLLQMQKIMDSKQSYRGFGLLDIEKQGLEILSQAPSRIDAVRQAHIEYLLEKENKTFSVLKNNPPPENSLVLLSSDLAESLTYLDRALKVALEDSKLPIRAHAEMHGNDLAADSRHQEAIPYFKVAKAEKKLAKSKAIMAAKSEAKAEVVKRKSKEELQSMVKSEKETKKFETDTDTLAEELGIDLDDF